jgi:hypothetical protein
MQDLASPPDSTRPDMLSRLSFDLDLNQLARDTWAIQRVLGIIDAADSPRLALVSGRGARRSSRQLRGHA